MKVKDIERTANIAWSPAKHNSILLAAGTAAQQFDASFSTNACLEIYHLNVSDPSFDTELRSTANCEHRFHKIIWGPFGGIGGGTIVGGCDNGVIQIYNVGKLLAGESGLQATHNNHNGAVHALDFNPFQENLLATGAGESEIYIWDMNNTNKPMTPGSKTQPFEDIVSIQWNKAVQPILAATFLSKCLVWDLRKNEPIIKLTDTISRIRWKTVAWHPQIATQLCLASEEDQAPTIQLWDLRFATQALNTFENHQRGILSMSWSTSDPDLLISSGKDNRILCWNPNTNNPGGEVLSEVVRTNQWNFDVSWCPKSPVLIGSPSFDGHISVYTVMGGHVNKQIQTTNKIADSFPGMDGYLQAPVPPQQGHTVTSNDISKAPRWLKRPVNAKFGFGGKLITVTTEKVKQVTQSGQVESITYSTYISQVVTESELVNKSAQLEQAMEYGNFIDFCRNKADMTSDQHKKYIWHFIRAHFEENSQSELLNLLGYRVEDVNQKLNQVIGKSDTVTILDGGLSNLNVQNDFENGDENDFDRIIQGHEKRKQESFEIRTGDDTEGLITEAILMGNIKVAVELCMKAKMYPEAIILSKAGGEDLFIDTQYRYLKENGTGLSSLITSLIKRDWSNVIDNCDVKDWKEALVAILSHCNDLEYPSLCEKLGDRLLRESVNNPKWAQDAQLCYICSGSFDQLVHSWSGGNVKHSSDDLQELVELVMLLKKAIEREGRSVEIAGGLAELLSKYAFILASQGNLQTALNYLGNSPHEQVTELRNRLLVCLGQDVAYGKRPSVGTAYGNQRQNYATPTYNTQFNPVNQNWQQPPARTYSPAPPVQPTRPPSGGSAAQGGLHSRGKYVLDPSVQSNAMSMGGNPIQTQSMFQTNALSAYNPTQYNPVAPTPINPSNSFNNPTALTSPFPQSGYKPVNTVQPIVPQTPSHALPAVNANQINPIGPPPPVTPVTAPGFNENPYAKPKERSNIGSTPGWNDPPAFTKSKAQTKPDIPQQEPITHPIYGSVPVSNMPIPVYPNQPPMPTDGPYTGQPTPPQTNFPSFQPPPPAELYNPSGFNTQAIGSNAFASNANINQQQNVIGRVEKPQPVVQKPPIPEEHIHMQTVFDELRGRCSGAATNLQMKRKLDDVSKKLDTLYDLLRERKLSPNTLSSLHQMCQMLQNGDYVSIQRLQTELAESPDFSQVASFMPGIKILLQCAQQLQVYLR